MAKKEEKKITLFKNKPLVKQGNKIYLGYRDESHMIEMDIIDTTVEDGVEIAKNVLIQLVDNTKAGRDRIVRKAERENLAKAMDIAGFWLTDALGENEEA